ncbi:hypothetical protein LPJ61_001895 [Coemansia biformis]|uniref:NmrA-like domain-containing protein n=1 Tax=Coemansia biformis TaxID=1286918 RepID=A0A9W7Y997_9FUNG|nr:hypothetical protein LPJ61_001895 [Coemansia biformis]
MALACAYKRVAVVGTGGYAGLFVRALAQTGHFDLVRAVTQPTQPADRAKRERLHSLRGLGAEVVVYEEATADAFRQAFTGIDVVVSGVGIAGVAGQIAMIDGAILAGVRWFIPSEFGVPPYKSVWMPFDSPLAAKATVGHHLQENARRAGLAYTIIYTGLALDYIDPQSIGLKPESGTATLVGRGGTPVSFTAVDDVVRLVVDIVRRPSEMQNRTVRYAGSTAMMRTLVKLVTSGDRGEHVRIVSIDEAKARFCELARKQDVRAFQIYARVLLEEGLGQVNRGCEPLDNGLFPGIVPEPVSATLARLMAAAEPVRIAQMAGPAAHRSQTGVSVTAGLGRFRRADAALLGTESP